MVLGYPDVYTAADHVLEVLAHKPIGLEGIDDVLVEGMKKKRLHLREVELLPAGRAGCSSSSAARTARRPTGRRTA